MAVNLCKQCGMCCRAISMGQSGARIKKAAIDKHPDAVFIVENWERISAKKAFRINPHLKLWTEQNRRRTYYRCKLLTVDNKCPLHGKGKPKTCSKYPYDRVLKDKEKTALYSENCGYKDFELEISNGKYIF